MSKHQKWDLKQMQSLPLEAKERMTLERLKVWYESWKKYTIYNTKTKKTRFVVHNEEPNKTGCFVKKTKKVNGKKSEVDVLVKGTKLKPTEYIESVEDGQVYVSFSGGKDSTVLADMCARFCKRYGYTLYLLFVNTGLEYPEIQKFVKTFAEWLRDTYNIVVQLNVVRPEMRFDEVIKTYGYPVISKEVSNTICGAKNSIQKGVYSHRLCKLGVKREEYGGLADSGEFDYEGSLDGSKFRQHKWRFLLDAPFNSSATCCDVMKKKPAADYEKKTGRKPIIATMATESMNRENAWFKHGCNAFSASKPKSTPIAFWVEQDIYHYIKKYNTPYCSVYGDIVPYDGSEQEIGQITTFDILGDYEGTQLKPSGCDRTGCIFCMFGIMQEGTPNRFQRLKETHPRQYDYCINGGFWGWEGTAYTSSGEPRKIDWINDDGSLMSFEEIEKEVEELKDNPNYKFEKVWFPNKEGLGLREVLDYIGVEYD